MTDHRPSAELRAELAALEDEGRDLGARIRVVEAELEQLIARHQKVVGTGLAGGGRRGLIGLKREEVEASERVERDRTLPTCEVRGGYSRGPYLIDKVTEKRIALKSSVGAANVVLFHHDGRPVSTGSGPRIVDPAKAIADWRAWEASRKP